MLDMFREVVVVDFEFTAIAGERPVPVCLVARELRSGRRFRMFDQFGPLPPYATGPDVLFVAYYASAELGVIAFSAGRCRSGCSTFSSSFGTVPMGRSDREAHASGCGSARRLIYFGLDTMDAVEKKELQQAIGNGTWCGCFTPEEILDYCEGTL